MPLVGVVISETLTMFAVISKPALGYWQFFGFDKTSFCCFREFFTNIDDKPKNHRMTTELTQ